MVEARKRWVGRDRSRASNEVGLAEPTAYDIEVNRSRGIAWACDFCGEGD